jgi:hypothetical protein
MRDLGLEGTGVYDLAQRSIGPKGQYVPRDVKGAGLEGTLVGFLLHVVRAGRDLGEVLIHALGERVIDLKQPIHRIAI